MKKIITFFKLWFGMIPECWNDAKIINDKDLQEAFRKFNEDILEDAGN